MRESGSPVKVPATKNKPTRCTAPPVLHILVPYDIADYDGALIYPWSRENKQAG